MGVDIHGWVEVRPDWSAPGDPWVAIISQVGFVVDRDDDLFARLFGVRSGASVHPIAPGRGIPDDVSDEVRREVERYRSGPEGCFLWPSWASWAEMKALDLEEFARHVEVRIADPTLRLEDLDHGEGGRAWRVIRGWITLYKMMQALADDYGEDNVRLVAWFDW